MPKQARLDVLQLQRLVQQRIREEINLSDRKIIRGTPVGMDSAQFFG
jgi:hypothetical protein